MTSIFGVQNTALNTTLINALSANNAQYLKQLANNGIVVFNSSGNVTDFDHVQLFGYPDITTFTVNYPPLGKTMIFQINGGTKFSLRHRVFRASSWRVYENSQTHPYVFPEELICVGSTTDTTPDPVVIGVTFPTKDAHTIEITKISKTYTVSQILANLGFIAKIKSVLSAPYGNSSGEYHSTPGNNQSFGTILNQIKAYVFTSSNFSNVASRNGGLVGAKVVSYPPDIKVYSRTGTRTQRRLPGFSSLSRFINSPAGSKITKSSPQYHTLTTASDGVRVRVAFPGLYYANSKGELKDTTVSFNIFYKTEQEVTWTQAINGETGNGLFSVTDNSSSQVDGSFTVWFSSKDLYTIKIDRVTDDSTDNKTRNESYLSAVVELEHTDIGYINRAVLGTILKATDTLSGTTPNITVVIRGRKVRTLPDMLNYGEPVIEKFSKNPVDIIIDAVTNKRYGGGRFFNLSNIDMIAAKKFWDYCDELVPIYIPKYEAVTFSAENRYNFNDYVVFNSLYYKCIRTFSDSQVNIPPTNTDYWEQLGTTGSNFVDMQKRFEFNFVVDQKYRLSDFIKKVCETCRVVGFWKGNTLSFFIDQPGTPKQQFSMGNIKPGSYQEDVIPFFDISNQIEATYKDASLDFNNKTVIAVDEERQLTEEVKSSEIQLFGLTNKFVVKRELLFYMRKAKAIKRNISFTTNLSALISEIGDVFYFQHYTPYYGEGGHVVRVSETEIILDKPIEVKQLYTYGIRIQRQNVTDPESVSDIFFYKTWVASSTTKVQILTVPSGHGVSVGDVFAAGIIEKESKLFRITNLTWEDTEVIISASEYNDTIYNEWEDTVQILDYSGFGNRPLSKNYVPNVVNITLSEKTVTSGSATSTSVVVNFKKVQIYNKTTERVKNYEVYYKESTSSRWTLAGKTNNTVMEIKNAVPGVKYFVAVRVRTTLNNTGFNSNDWFQQEKYSITVVGEVDSIYENGCYENGVFLSSQDQTASGSKAGTTRWLMEPSSVNFTFTDI